jgi:hypothetical protein
MKTIGNAKEVSQGLGMLSIKDLVKKEKELILKTKRTELELEIKRLKGL